MRIGSIRPAAGATRAPKRRGKGGATGGKIPAWFEGGQMPLQRRVPKRGFKNPGRVEYQIVKVGRLAAAPAQAVVDAAWLRAQRIVRRPGPVKLLAGGELKTALKVKVDAASAQARKVVEAAGGTIELEQPKAAEGATTS